MDGMSPVFNTNCVMDNHANRCRAVRGSISTALYVRAVPLRHGLCQNTLTGSILGPLRPQPRSLITKQYRGIWHCPVCPTQLRFEFSRGVIIMKWVKAAAVGVLGSLVMFLFMMFGIYVTGMAPFNVPPSAAFLLSLGLPGMPLNLVIHFGYGAMGSIVLVSLFQKSTDYLKGFGLAIFLWLIMMFIYSPVIGWGIFGFGPMDLPADAPLHLEPGLGYPIITLGLHLAYGAIIGCLNPRWTLQN